MILCIGEILADLIGQEKDDKFIYNRFAGGAPFNVCCAINNFGKKATFIGCVGNDNVGKFLISFAEKRNITHQILIDNDSNSTLAFVEIDKTGERDFTFLRKNTADYKLKFELINKNLLNASNLIHLGSLMLSEDVGIRFFNSIIKFAKQNNKLISFDVNLRLDIFNSNNKNLLLDAIKKCDIVKMSEDELCFLTKEKNIAQALKNFSNLLVLVTLGSKGSLAYFKEQIIEKEGIKVTSIDTTGAGDAFLAGFLSILDIENITENEIKKALTFGNICGGLTTTKLGAIDALPSLTEIEKFNC